MGSSNRDIDAARRYHSGTNHSVTSVQSNAHYLDWDNQPSPFKIYRGVPAFPLPRPEGSWATMPELAAIAASTEQGSSKLTFAALARLLGLSAGITRTKTFPDGQRYYFRAAACTGALYHIDVYLCCGELDGLPAGVYQFGPQDFALHQLRAGDFRGALVAASGDEPSVQQAPATLILASTYWRNSWKYQSRAYRHCFWDSGTILANLFAVAAAEDVRARLVCGFVDDAVERLLGLDPEREGALALVALGHDADPIAPIESIAPVSFEVEPLSAHEIEYPAIVAMHSASKLQTPDEVRAWRASALPPSTASELADRTQPLTAMSSGDLPREGIETVIMRRGSSRQFALTAIGFDQLSTILGCAASKVPCDFQGRLGEPYLIVNAVDGLAAGAYWYDRRRDGLELGHAGDFRRHAGYLGLGQELPADASVNLYGLCDLDPVLQAFGNRGYRLAQLESAIAGGKAYLAAYALRLGATGLTFFDDDVTEFFSPHAAGKSVMFLTAIGRSAKTK